MTEEESVDKLWNHVKRYMLRPLNSEEEEKLDEWFYAPFKYCQANRPSEDHRICLGDGPDDDFCRNFVLKPEVHCDECSSAERVRECMQPPALEMPTIPSTP